MDISIEIIDIEDEDPPIFTSDSIFTVEENQRQIGIVTVTDANSSDIVFSISGTDILIASDGMSFAVEPDYETKTKYIATVTASDGTNQSAQEILNIININDNSPVISSNNSFEALENQTSIGVVIATDADGDLLTYSIQAEQGTNNNNVFIQDSDSTLDETDFYKLSHHLLIKAANIIRIYDIDDEMKIILRNLRGAAQEELTYGKGSDTTINVLDYTLSMDQR